MIDRPLGIADLLHPGEAALFSEGITRPGSDSWYWCRQHKRAEHVSVPPAWPNNNGLVVDCVRIGPFMSEREANRLGFAATGTNDLRRPLGMEVEQ